MKPKVNVLLIVLDTTREDDFWELLDAGELPVFARLAREGVSFPNTRAHSSWTVPNHASLFTGLYPAHHQTHHEHPNLLPEFQTLAEMLAPTHLTAGFSENPHIGKKRGFSQGFDSFFDTWRFPRKAPYPPTIDMVRRWLAENDSEPFFVFVNLFAPHLPYAPPQPWWPELETGSKGVIQRELAFLTEWNARFYIAGKEVHTEEEFRLLRDLYRGEIRYEDARVGYLLATLAEQQRLDSTLIIVTSDHGENIGEHGLMEHQFGLWETVLRVPLVLRLPGVFEGGELRQDTAQLMDLPVTILDVLGVVPPSLKVDGQSLREPLRDRPQLAEYYRPEGQRWRFEKIDPDFDFDRLARRHQSVQEGPWKLILSEGYEPALYNLEEDPGERNNLARSFPQISARLKSIAEKVPFHETRKQGEEITPDDEEARAALRALGYGGS